MSDVLLLLKKNQIRLLPLAILVFLGIVTMLTLTLTKRSQELRSRALADNGQLTLSLLNAGSIPPGGTFDIAVNMVSSQPVVGADILLEFDNAKLMLDPNQPDITLRQGTSSVFQTFAPVDESGVFDKARVIASANSTGIVEFGIVAFNWGTNTLPSPNPTNSSMSPVITLSFKVKNTAPAGETHLRYKNEQIGGTNSTTDSNIVAIPTGGGDPEDILQTDDPTPYPNAVATVIISGFASPAPTQSPGVSPSATPGTSTCNSCYNFDGSTDQKVSILDIQYVTGLFGKPELYNSKYDIYCGSGTPNTNPDGVINVLDIQMVAGKWNQTSCTPP